jgi:hypothetical protein
MATLAAAGAAQQAQRLVDGFVARRRQVDVQLGRQRVDPLHRPHHAGRT